MNESIVHVIVSYTILEAMVSISKRRLVGRTRDMYNHGKSTRGLECMETFDEFLAGVWLLLNKFKHRPTYLALKHVHVT